MGQPNTIWAILELLEPSESGCRMWPRSTDHNGYGRVRFHGRQRKVHCVVYEHFRGPIPEGMQLDHTCLNPACANPDHLEPVTPRVNTLRSRNPTAINHAKTECKRGHPLSGPNLYVNPKGERQCRECARLRSRIYEELYHEERISAKREWMKRLYWSRKEARDGH